MEKKTILIWMLFLISGVFYYYLASWDESESYNEKVIRIIDGDTVVLEDGNHVRFLGINTPEKSMNNFEKAKEFLKVTENQTVRIESYGVDKYGRILGHVFFRKTHLNEEILKNGLGTLYYYEEDEYFKELKKAEEEAREKGLGIWKKSSNFGCLELIELKYIEETKRCSDEEVVRIKNNCEFEIEFLLKDDATHIYERNIKGEGIYEENFSCIWNNDGDTLYVWDNDGLLIWERY